MPNFRRLALPALATLLLTAAAHSVPAQQALTLEEVVTLRSVATVRLNPAGDRIAYTLGVPRELYVDDDGPAYHELHVVDFDGTATPFVTGHVDVSDFAWAPDGRSIYFLAQRDPDAKTNSLYEIALGGGEARKVFTHSSSIATIFPSPDGRTIAFVATDAPPDRQEELETKGFKALVYEESVQAAHVWLLDLETNEAERKELPGHASSFAWAADGARYAVALAPTPLIDDSFTSSDIYVVDRQSGAVRNRMGSVGKLGQFAFSPDGERIAYIGSVDIHDPASGRLYVASSAGGERRDLVPDYAGHVVDFAWSDDVTIDCVRMRRGARDRRRNRHARPAVDAPYDRA